MYRVPSIRFSGCFFEVGKRNLTHFFVIVAQTFRSANIGRTKVLRYELAGLKSCATYWAMNSKEITSRAEHAVLPVVESLGLRLVECEFVNDHGWILRLYIERPEGPVTIEDCQKASRAVSAVLDVEDVVKARYALEVSSPGLNRPLKTAADFQRFVGELVRLKTAEPIDGRANYFGTLKGMDGDSILMNVDGVDHRIPMDKLGKARLEYKG